VKNQNTLIPAVRNIAPTKAINIVGRETTAETRIDS